LGSGRATKDLQDAKIVIR